MVVKNNNYYFTYQHPHGDLDVVVGDEKQEKFYPRMKIKKWENEVNLSVGVIDDEPEKGVIENIEDHIAWKKGDIEAHFYPREDLYAEDDKRGFEFEVHLKSKPQTNVIQLSIETKGLNFFYQPPLTSEEKLQGASRPESVEGSYAVYHKTEAGDKRAIGGKHYAAGKAFHIYRPIAHDADGKQVYCDIKINEEKGILSITVPQEFIDKAIYPLIVDPTFGYTTVGGSNVSGGIQGYIDVCTFPSGGAGTVTSMDMYVYNGTQNLQLGIYNEASTNAALIGHSGNIAGSSSAAWVSGAVSGTISSANYMIGFQFSSTTAGYYYDAGSAKISIFTEGTYGTWPSTVTWTNYEFITRTLSIYVTYILPVGPPILFVGNKAPQPVNNTNISMY